jgi:hypothetical protein
MATDPVRGMSVDKKTARAPEAIERPPAVSPTEISREAYARYVERGREEGHDVEDWLAAEARLRREHPGTE